MNGRVQVSGRGWAYAGAILGGAVSIAANVAHSYVPPAGTPRWTGRRSRRGASARCSGRSRCSWRSRSWPGIAWPTGRRWVAVRFLGLLPVALVAAVVSYRHLSGLLAFYGEDAAHRGHRAARGGRADGHGDRRADRHRRAALAGGRIHRGRPAARDASHQGRSGSPAPASVNGSAPARTPRFGPRAGRGRADTAVQVARWRDRHPDMTSTEIARRVGVSDRTVRRHLSGGGTPAERTAPAPESVSVPVVTAVAA